MSEDNLTVHILRELREEIRSTRGEVRSMGQRLDGVDQRLDTMDQRFERLESQVATRDDLVAVELRMATRITEQTAATRDLYDLINANLQLRDRIERCEQDLTGIKGRLG